MILEDVSNGNADRVNLSFEMFFACDVAERVLGITNDFRHMIRWALVAIFVKRHSFDAS